MKRPSITERESLEIAQRYKAGEKSRSICQRFACTSMSVLNHCRRHNVKSNPVGSSSRRYTLNENYFSVIDTEDKAYFLGLLGSDGNVSSDSNQIELGLSGEEDSQLLKKFLCALGSDAPIKRHTLTYQGAQPAYRIAFSSAKIKHDLSKHGIVPKKSLIYTFNDKIEPHLVRHYVRGYFDGDGSVSWKRDKNFLLSITSSPMFIQELSSQIYKYTGLNSHIETRSKSKAKSLKIGGNFTAFIFLDWIYRDASVFLPRKHRKYLQCKEVVSEKISEPSNFYNLYTHPKTMANAARCAELLRIKFDMAGYNGLSITRSQQNVILSLYAEHHGIKRISKITGHSLRVVANTLSRNGTEMRPSNRLTSLKEMSTLKVSIPTG